MNETCVHGTALFATCAICECYGYKIVHDTFLKKLGRSYRRLRGGKWARVTGWLWGHRWVRVPCECKEQTLEDYCK